MASNLRNRRQVGPLIPELDPYQTYCVEKIRQVRSLLIFFGIGTGKTRLGAACCRDLIDRRIVKGAVILTPTPLMSNFRNEVEKYFWREEFADSDLLYFGTHDSITNSNYDYNLSNKLLIIDEVHRFRNYTSDRTKKLIQIALKAKRVILLSGTPIVNSSADLLTISHIMFNIDDVQRRLPFVSNNLYEEFEILQRSSLHKLKALIRKSTISKRSVRTKSGRNIRKSIRSVFGSRGRNDEYLEEIRMMIYNKIKRKPTEREVKVVSKFVINEFVHEIDLEKSKINENINSRQALVRLTKLILTPEMTKKAFEGRVLYHDLNFDYQLNIIEIAMDERMADEYFQTFNDKFQISQTFNEDKLADMLDKESDDNTDGNDSFLSKSRQNCNYMAIEAKSGDKKSLIDSDGNLQFFQKAERLVENVIREFRYNDFCRIIIYSSFILNGLQIISELLMRHSFNKIVHKVDFDQIDGQSKKIAEIVNTYNNSQRYILLISPAASEGIDLKETTSIHLLDPVWNIAQREQIIGRGVRRASHEDSKFKVPIYQYILTAPDGYSRLTSDQRLMDIQFLKDKTNEPFINTLKSISNVMTKPLQKDINRRRRAEINRLRAERATTANHGTRRNRNIIESDDDVANQPNQPIQYIYVSSGDEDSDDDVIVID